jgi:hypothetical protein
MRSGIVRCAMISASGKSWFPATWSMSSWVSATYRGMAVQTSLNSSIICRACGRSDCVSTTILSPRLIRPELASHTRFASFSTAKQWSLTCCIFIELVFREVAVGPEAVLVNVHAHPRPVRRYHLYWVR